MEIKVTSNAQQIVDELSDDINAYRQELQFTLFRALSFVEASVIDNLRGASGLHVRSGSLLNSIYKTPITYERNTLSGGIGSAGIPYAAIHEFGGITKAHDIFPRAGKALKFQMGGKNVFAKSVHHPGSNIPARPYLGPALESNRQKIIEEFGLFIQASFAPKG